MLTHYLRTGLRLGLRLKLSAFGLNRRAVTAIEYALIAGLVAVVIVTAVSELGRSTQGSFSRVAAEM